jgi:tRNA threonylcarbamoyladenosine biosynthesis protein TsaB
MRRVILSDFFKPVLAFDSSLGGCIAAVLNGGAVRTRFLETDREQAVKLMPMLQDLLGEAKVAFADIGLIVTTVGPGSFTGLRISLSAARSLGLALDIPVQGVSTFEVMARSAVPERLPCLVVLETKRTDFYVQAFGPDKNLVGEGSCMEPRSLCKMIASGDYILCGDGLGRLGAEGRERKLLDPEILARTGLARFLENGEKADKPEPVYLREADVSVSNKVQREINDLPADV